MQQVCNRSLFTSVRRCLVPSSNPSSHTIIRTATRNSQAKDTLRTRSGRDVRYQATAAAVASSEVIAESEPPPPRSNIRHQRPFSEFLTDTFHRQHTYLRISITERCNLRCLYCMPEEGVQLSPKPHLLTPQEILYLSSLFISQGITKIRLTGGEPMIHPSILPLLRDIGDLRAKGLKELAITTNGLNLARKLPALADAGVTGINLSLDTLEPLQFELMTRRKGFEAVMSSIERILAHNANPATGAPIKLKINAVVIRGLNDAQLLPFVEFTRDRDIEVRFIEYMPFDGNRWNNEMMMTYAEMLAAIRERFPTFERVQDHPNDTSKTWRVPGFKGRVGFITSMTENFCAGCNRLRITSDGNLKVCLFGNKEVSLRDALRDRFNEGEPIDEEAWGALREVEMERWERQRQGLTGGAVGEEYKTVAQENERQLLEIIGAAVKRKKEKHAGLGVLEHMRNRPMILIGG